MVRANPEKEAGIVKEKTRFDTNTSISGFLKNLSTDGDFGSKTEAASKNIRSTLIDFEGLLTAPVFVPQDEPISIFRNVFKGLEVEDELTVEEGFKDTLRDVLKKYVAKATPGETVEEAVEPKEEGRPQIPEIGRSAGNGRILQGTLPDDEA